MKICMACNERFAGNEWRCPRCAYSPPFRDGYPLFAPNLVHGDGTDAEYRYAELFEAESKHFWFRTRNRLLIWALGRHFPNAAKFLELGCGTGFVASGIRMAFPALAVSIGDVLVKGLTFARERLPGISLFQLDACHLPFEAEFDVIGAFDMLEHIEKDEDVLSQMFQAVRPGGGIILTVPQHPFLWSRADDFSHHKRRYTRQELASKLKCAGFKPLQITSFMTLLLPALFLARSADRARNVDFDPLAELRLNPTLNAMLTSVLGMECALIKGGASLPTGGSLLAVARRSGG